MYRELLSFLIKRYTKMCGKLGEIPGTFSCSKSVALLFAVEGYYLHLQKSEDQAQPKSCRCDTKSSQKVSTILVNSTKIVSNNMLSFGIQLCNTASGAFESRFILRASLISSVWHTSLHSNTLCILSSVREAMSKVYVIRDEQVNLERSLLTNSLALLWYPALWRFDHHLFPEISHYARTFLNV